MSGEAEAREEMIRKARSLADSESELSSARSKLVEAQVVFNEAQEKFESRRHDFNESAGMYFMVYGDVLHGRHTELVRETDETSSSRNE